MKKNLQGLGIGSQYDELCNTTVQGLGGSSACQDRNNYTDKVQVTFICTLLDLLVLPGKLDEIQNLQRS
jgi:hypothetical protein